MASHFLDSDIESSMVYMIHFVQVCMAGGRGACIMLVHFNEAGEMGVVMENIHGEAREWTKKMLDQLKKVVSSKYI